MTTELRETCHKNKFLYKKIKGIENQKEWFLAVTETKDLRFIVQNVEARIAAENDAGLQNKNLDPKLWRLYIIFLIKKDINVITF